MTELSDKRAAAVALAKRYGLDRRPDLLLRPPDPAKLMQQRRALLADRFDKQRGFILDQSRKKFAFCSRRAGKTENVPNDLFESAVAYPGTLQMYCGLTRARAKELMWEPLKAAASKYNLDHRANESELFIRIASGQGSVVRLTGADKMNEADKKRGDKVRRVRIDEAQSFSFHVLEALVEKVLGPTLEDLGGDIGLLGTPGEVCAGYWYRLTHPDHSKRTTGWSPHSWTFLENPHVPLIHARYHSGELAKDYGGPESATFMREWRGKWVKDSSGLIYRYDEDRNGHEIPPDQLVGPGWLHTLGWDIGHDDAMALVVWAFNVKKSRNIYEAFSWKASPADGNVTTDTVMDLVADLEKVYDFVGKSADTGGLGKLIVSEVQRRRSQSFEPAQKTDKHAHIKLFNEGLDGARTFIRKNSVLASELAVLPRVAGWKPEDHDGRPAPEDPGFPNHAADAGLYSWRRAFPFLHEPDEEEPEKGSAAAMKRDEDRLEEALMEQAQEEETKAWWDK